MHIRLARPTDAEPLASIHVEAWKAAYRGQVAEAYLDRLSVEGRLDLWNKLLAEPAVSAVILVLTDGDQPAGFAYCTTRAAEPGGDLAGELALMCLDPRLWRKG